MMRVIEVDADRDFRVIRARDSSGAWWRLEGSCLRCGKCCRAWRHKCPSLVYENVDGTKLAKCLEQAPNTKSGGKPWGCKLFPRDPETNLNKGCGYEWVRESTYGPQSIHS